MTRRFLLSSVLFVGIIGVTFLETANGQTRRIEVVLEKSGNDLVGESLYYFVKEELRKSTAFDLRDSPKGAFIRVRIHTMDLDTPLPAGKGSAVVVIVTQLPDDGLLYDQLFVVGRDRVREVATGIVAGIDKYLEELFRDAAKAIDARKAKEKGPR